MPAQPESDLSLSPEIREAIWRIFGAGAAPGTSGSAFDNIETVIRARVPPAHQDHAIATIGGWFDSGTRVRWLKPDRAASVANLVIEGVGPRRSEDAIWAIGSIGLDQSVRLLTRRWSAGEVDTFVEAAVHVLNGVGGRITTNDRFAEPGDAEVAGFCGAVSRYGLVGAFARLEEQGLELVNEGLHPTVANLVDLTVELAPEQFPRLVSALEAPAMQARAARRMVARTPGGDARPIVEWIGERATDAVIALTIVHVLSAVRELDAAPVSRKERSCGPAGNGIPGSAPGPPAPAAVSLVRQLLERLGSLDPPDCLRWIGEILNQAPKALSSPDDGQKPVLLARIEDSCMRLAVRLLREPGSADLLPHVQTGLLPVRRRHRVRHQMAIARAMCESSPDGAEELARATLDEHRRQMAELRNGRHPVPDWGDWTDREWLEGLGAALAMSQKDLDLCAWVALECRHLPLRVWDAEEDPDGFVAAEQTAQHWFLVALLAIPQRSALGRPLAPPVVRAFAEAVWAHCDFCRQHVDTHPEASVAAELAARYAVRYGQGSDQWLLDQARREGLGPRALCVLLEERRSRSDAPGGEDPDFDDLIVAELMQIASDRFDDGCQFDLETLRHWGRLWLSLGAVDPAERTAMAIASFPLRAADRNDRILALRLLGLVVRRRRLRRGVTEQVLPLYNQLWPVLGGTPVAEMEARREIDEAFASSELIVR